MSLERSQEIFRTMRTWKILEIQVSTEGGRVRMFNETLSPKMVMIKVRGMFNPSIRMSSHLVSVFSVSFFKNPEKTV